MHKELALVLVFVLLFQIFSNTRILSVDAQSSFDFQIKTSTNSPIQPGSETTFWIQLLNVKGSTPNVKLSVSGLPNGVNVSFDGRPGEVISSGSSPTKSVPSAFNMYVLTSNSVSPGTYNIKITGTASGISRSGTATLIIQGSGTVDGYAQFNSPQSFVTKPGDKISISANVRNTGTINGDFKLFYYENLSICASSSDVSDTSTISAGQSKTLSIDCVIPTGISPGTKNVDVYYDMTNQGGSWNKKTFLGSITITINTPIPGTLNVEVYNQDDSNADVDIFVDGVFVQRKLGLSPGETHQYSSTVIGDSNHTVRMVWVDSDSGVSYSKENSSVYVPSGQSVGIRFVTDLHVSTAQQTPNLTILGISLDPHPPISGTSTYIFPKMYNPGSASANGFSVEVYVDGQLIGSRPNLSLGPGDTDPSIGFSWVATYGPHTVKAIIDSDNNVQEGSESDNTYSINFIVENSSTETTPVTPPADIPLPIVPPVEENKPIVQTQTFDFTMSAKDISGNILPGREAESQLSIILINGNSENVSLSCLIRPSTYGDCYVSPPSVSPTTTARVIAKTTDNTKAGTYTVMITGYSNSVKRDASFTFKVEPDRSSNTSPDDIVNVPDSPKIVPKKPTGGLKINQQEIILDRYSEIIDPKVTGMIDDYQRGKPVDYFLRKPDGNTQHMTNFATKDGKFEFYYDLTKESVIGTYALDVKYGNSLIGSVSFTVKEKKTEPVPIKTKPQNTDGIDESTSIKSKISKKFSAEKNGFKFSNDVFRQQVSQEKKLTKKQIDDAIARYPVLGRIQPSELDKMLGSEMPQNTASDPLGNIAWSSYLQAIQSADKDGYCYGMAKTAIDYFKKGKSIDELSMENVRSEIINAHAQQNLNLQLLYLTVFARLSDNGDEIKKISDKVTPKTPQIIGMLGDDWNYRHAVVAYDVSSDADGKYVQIYDPDFPEQAQILSIYGNDNIDYLGVNFPIKKIVFLGDLSDSRTNKELAELADKQTQITTSIEPPTYLEPKKLPLTTDSKPKNTAKSIQDVAKSKLLKNEFFRIFQIEKSGSAYYVVTYHNELEGNISGSLTVDRNFNPANLPDDAYSVPALKLANYDDQYVDFMIKGNDQFYDNTMKMISDLNVKQEQIQLLHIADSAVTLAGLVCGCGIEFPLVVEAVLAIDDIKDQTNYSIIHTKLANIKKTADDLLILSSEKNIAMLELKDKEINYVLTRPLIPSYDLDKKTMIGLKSIIDDSITIIEKGKEISDIGDQTCTTPNNVISKAIKNIKKYAQQFNDKKINDSRFLELMENEVRKQIVESGHATKSSGGSYKKIPNDIKNKLVDWVKGKRTDAEMISTIKYLFDKKFVGTILTEESICPKHDLALDINNSLNHMKNSSKELSALAKQKPQWFDRYDDAYKLIIKNKR